MKIKTAVQLTIALSASLAYCDNSDFLFYDVGGDDAIYGVTVDPKDNSIYLAGQTTTSLSIAFGGNTPIGKYDVYLVKMAPNGVRFWTQMIGSDRDDMLVNPAEFITSKSVNPDSWQRVSSANPAIDSVTGDVYLQGLTFGSFHGQSTSVGSVNAFITRFRSNGTFVRTLFYGQPNPNSQRTVNPSKIMVYNSAIYVVGNVLHGTLFDLPSYVGNWDFYILKFTTSNDQIQFADGRVFGSGWNDFAFGFDIDPVSGIAMIAGRTDNKLYASYYYGGSDAFELRIPVNNLRNGDWKVSQFGSALGDGAYGIVFDQKYTKTFYITGIVSDNVYFDPNNQNKISIVGGADQFVASILPDGTRKWISMFRNTGSVEISRSIVVNPIDGNLYVLGGYLGTLDADLRAIQQSIFAGIDISLFVVRPTNGSVIRSRIAGMAWVNTKNQCDMAFSGAFLDNGTLLLGSYMGESAELLVYQGANFFKFYYNIFNSNMIEDASPKIPPPQMTETITSTVFVGLLTQTVTVTTTSARSTFYLVFNTTVYTSTPTVQGGCRTPIFETTCLFTPTKSCDEELLVAANDFNAVSSNFYFVVAMAFAVILAVLIVIIVVCYYNRRKRDSAKKSALQNDPLASVVGTIMRTGPMNTLPAPAPMQMLTYPQQGLPTAGYPSNGYETAGYLPAPANHDPAGEVQNYPMPAKPTMNPRISQLRSETEGNVISNNNMSTSPKARENALQALDEIDKIE